MEAVPFDMPMPVAAARMSQKNPATLKANIPGFERLLDHNPNARIVWQHIGWDNTGEMTIELLRRLLKAHPNLYIAFRSAERIQDDTGNSIPNRIVGGDLKIKPEWMEFFKEFPDRFVVGTDEFIPIPGDTTKIPQSFEETWRLMAQFPPELAAKIGRENAIRIYNLQ
jgi:predicted TIM-barrel fold metal-dependent hydrolase